MGGAAAQPVRLTAENKAVIENKANAVLLDYGIQGPYIDIVRLAKQIGFVIQTMPMIGNTVGIMLVDDHNTIMDTGSHKLIIVDEDQDAKESRFITAHELGHYFLHKNDSIQYAHMDSNPMDDRDLSEREADYFASCLLMPREHLEHLACLNKGEGKNITKFLAEAFRVPVSRVRERFLRNAY